MWQHEIDYMMDNTYTWFVPQKNGFSSGFGESIPPTEKIVNIFISAISDNIKQYQAIQ